MRALVFLLSITLALCAARGDEPLPPPTKVTRTSPSGRIRAISDPESNTTRVEDAKSHRLLWTLPEWHRAFFVPDDGNHLVTEYGGLNLIPTGLFIGHIVLFTFWEEGKKIREVRVKDFIPDRRILERTASHYLWRETIGIDQHGRLKVERVDHRIFLFDVATGKEIKT
jgi:hypothetical protein